MNIVLDTNVLVSGLLSPYGHPAEIIRMICADELIVYYDARIITEYTEVLSRPKFKLDQDNVSVLLEYIVQTGQAVASIPLDKPLPDPDDEIFLEIAISGGTDCLVTGNLGHFPKSLCGKVNILLPRDFLLFYKKSKPKLRTLRR
jgi:uncharacterized protein